MGFNLGFKGLKHKNQWPSQPNKVYPSIPIRINVYTELNGNAIQSYQVDMRCTKHLTWKCVSWPLQFTDTCADWSCGDGITFSILAEPCFFTAWRWKVASRSSTDCLPSLARKLLYGYSRYRTSYTGRPGNVSWENEANTTSWKPNIIMCQTLSGQGLVCEPRRHYSIKIDLASSTFDFPPSTSVVPVLSITSIQLHYTVQKLTGPSDKMQGTFKLQHHIQPLC